MVKEEELVGFAFEEAMEKEKEREVMGKEEVALGC